MSLGWVLFVIGFLVHVLSDESPLGRPVMAVGIFIFSIGVVVYILSPPGKT